MKKEGSITVMELMWWGIAIVVVTSVSLFLMRGNFFKQFYESIPDYKISQEYVKTIDQQESVQLRQKTTDSNIQYPTAAIEYAKGRHDLFIFRWNPQIKQIQMLCSINGEPIKSDWLIGLVLCEKLLSGEGVYAEEQRLVKKVMESKDELEMITTIAATSQEDQKARIKFITPRALQSSKNEIDLYNNIAAETIYIPTLDQNTHSYFQNLNSEQVEYAMYEAKEWENEPGYWEYLADYSSQIKGLFTTGKTFEFEELENSGWDIDKFPDEKGILHMQDNFENPQYRMEAYVSGEKNKITKIMTSEGKEIRHLRIKEPIKITN